MDKREKLYTVKDCLPLEGEHLEGKVLVLNPNRLKPEYRTPENQLWRAESGFGCTPALAGRAVYAVCLADNEGARWSRNDFIGILKVAE